MDDIKQLEGLPEQLKFPSYEAFPDIELYMDQVLDFLSRSRTGLRDDDKLSSAMVNNYIKAELLPRAKGKKYAREHLVHLAIILRLKKVLSVTDTGTLIKQCKRDKEEKDFFNGFRDMIENSAIEVRDKVLNATDELPEIAMRLAVESYICKITSEFIIDSIDKKEENEKEKGRGDAKTAE